AGAGTHVITLAPGVVVDVRLRDLSEPMVCLALLVKRFLQEPRFVGPVEAARVRAGAAVGRDLVMLEPLDDADDCGIARILCRGTRQPVVTFFDEAGETDTPLRRRLLAPMREDQLQPLAVQP